jgi:biopolymer transport protein ExbD
MERDVALSALNLAPRRRKRPPINLPLTAMIDIFSLMVIFLIKGTVFGAVDVSTAGIKLPISISKESIESAPQVLISTEKVKIPSVGGEFPLELFRPGSSGDGSAEAATLKLQLKAFVANMPREAKTSGVLLNVVADKSIPYQNIFDTVKFFRDCGFETLLFVATGETK